MSSPDDTKPETGAGTTDFRERRTHTNLREIFDAACWLTTPFFDSKQTWGNASLTIYARQALCEAYPDLTQQEIALLYASVERYHKALNRKK